MRRKKTDPLSLLVSLKDKLAAARPVPLAVIPPAEIAAFQALRQALARSRLFPYLDQTVCINERLIANLYPGLDPLADPLLEMDSFIYVYESMSGRDINAGRARGDLRKHFSELGFRQMLLELNRSCRIHQFCADNLSNAVVIEPITKKPTSDARKEALAIHPGAKAVFHQIAERISAEIDGDELEVPRVLMDARRFAWEMKAILEPLAWASRQLAGRKR
jgi:hypothetical protein